MFVDIALKAVGIQLIYAAIVVFSFTIAERIQKKKEAEKQKEVHDAK